ncbi:acyl-CoA dehydrogenase family protein [Sphingobium chungbukense]|nr:acyl-CoA dehydrogenase family protein [Sphingobium chungbukense]
MNDPTTIEALQRPRILDWPADPRAVMTAWGAESLLTEEQEAIRDVLNGFARRVMRPLGQKLDRIDPGEQLAPGSPYWSFMKEFATLGISVADLMAMPEAERAVLLCIANEEFGYGDGGLAIVLGATMLPHVMMHMFGRSDLIAKYPEGVPGCWAITEPDHGTDMLDPNGAIFAPNAKYGRPNCVAKFEADRIVLQGQKAAWCSNAPAAEICVLYVAADTGNGADPRNGACIIVPLDAPGVTKGRVIAKMGQRALPQGELFFDNVELPLDNVIAGPEDYKRAVYGVHAEANTLMGAVWTGNARSAYELAWDYAHERKQGGVPIIRHQSVAQRLFHMARKIELSRALTRRVALYNATAPTPSLPSAMMAKITGTQTAFEVASDAMQIFGGNGMTDEYPIEKTFRDARLALIEDGCNEILSIKGGYGLADPERFA